MEYNDTILTFDTLYTTNEIQLLKLALPLLSNQLQPIAATLIKMRELEYCLCPIQRYMTFRSPWTDWILFSTVPCLFATSNRKSCFPSSGR
jgi:hypothetical protein